VDRETVVGVFHAMVPEQASPSSGVRAGAAAGGARVIALPSPTWRARAGAVAAASAAVLGMGAISAAAYQGVLPDPVQNVMHVVIGAPEPTPQASASSAAAKRHKAKANVAATNPRATTEAPVRVTPTHPVEMPRAMAQGLCRAWSNERAHGVAEARSTAFRSLIQAAGGTEVDRYCLAQDVKLAPAKTAPAKATNVPPTVKPKPPEPTKSVPPLKPTTKVPPPKPTKTPGPTVTTTVPTPTTTTVVPNPTATTTAGSGSGAGSNGGTGAGSGGAGSQGAANKSTDTPAGGNGKARGQG
jgi:hypothetical protein